MFAVVFPAELGFLGTCLVIYYWLYITITAPLFLVNLFVFCLLFLHVCVYMSSVHVCGDQELKSCGDQELKSCVFFNYSPHVFFLPCLCPPPSLFPFFPPFFPFSLSLCLSLDWAYYWAWSLLICPAWLSSQNPLVTASLALGSQTFTTTLSFYVGVGVFKPEFSSLCSKHFTDSHLPSPKGPYLPSLYRSG